MEIRQYFEMIRRWSWLLILGAALGAGTAYGISMRQARIYQSKGSVRLWITARH